MDLAARRLRDSAERLDRIVGAAGYTSVYAFSRARGMPPRHFRTLARAK